MNRIVVAFLNDSFCARVCDMLEGEGIPVKSKCRSGAEAMRAITNMGGGIVVCGYKLADMTANHLAYDLTDSAYMLVLAPPEQLDYCEDYENIFKLQLPASKSEVAASLKILMQAEGKLHRTVLPRRTPEEETLIVKAKELLTERNSMTEQEAHRFLQRRSMNTGLGKAEVARLIIEAYDTIV